MERDSIGDFAEFIRSTGPPSSYNETPAPPKTAPAANGHRKANSIVTQGNSSVTRLGTATSLPKRSASSMGRSRLQARDAVIPIGDTSSDLIDFIRQGPPSSTPDSHRIPRTVAPFRTTMDSDQMSGAVGGKAVDASLPDPRYSQASTNVSIDQSMQSKNSSITSQSALLNNYSRINKSTPLHNRKDFDEEDMMPQRKTRRVRDPYAIDFSDEEDEYEAVARPKPIQEESLADFLRNVPPPENNTTPIFVSVPPKDIKKKSSVPSLMSRFGRNGNPAPPIKPVSKGNDSRPSATRIANSTPQLPSYTPISTQFSTTSPATYTSARGNYVSQLDSARNPAITKVSQKSYQARDATHTTSRTSDLADFLRSEPPASMTGPAVIQSTIFSSHAQKEETSGFSRMFGRRRKVAT